MNVEMDLRTMGSLGSSPCWSMSEKAIQSMVKQMADKLMEDAMPLSLNYSTQQVGAVLAVGMALPEPKVAVDLSDSLDPGQLAMGPSFQAVTFEEWGENMLLIYEIQLHGVSVFPKADADVA